MGDDGIGILRAMRAGTQTGEEEETRDEGAFSERFAIGTGQFELPHPDPVAAEAHRGDEPVSRIMARKLICARPEMDASEVRARLLERGVHGAPVVDAWGRAVGVVSRTDLLENEVTSEPGRLTVGDIMTPMVFSMTADAPIARAAAVMAYEGVHRVVVVDRGGYVVGLVSTLDIARWMGWSAGYPVGREP